MANYVTTNIRISEEDYLRLKAEAAKKRTSFSAIIRQNIVKRPMTHSKKEVEQMLKETDELAQENAKYTKGFDIVKTIREMRSSRK